MAFDYLFCFRVECFVLGANVRFGASVVFVKFVIAGKAVVC